MNEENYEEAEGVEKDKENQGRQFRGKNGREYEG